MKIFDTLTSKEKELLRYEDYPKESTLFHEEEECLKVGIVLKGNVSIQSYSENGNIILYNKIKEDEMFGSNLIFSSFPFYKGDGFANCDTTVAYLTKENLIHILQNNRNFLSSFLNHQSNFAISLNSKIKLLSMPLVKDRFTYYMNSHHNAIQYSSITKLAEELGISREVLSRYLNTLKKENKIQIMNKTIQYKR